MDILNWLRIKKQQLIRTTLDSPKDLVMLGADVSFQKRGDKYQSYAIPAEDFLATAARPYKVYTALLTQSGGSSDEYLLSGTLTIGVTYNIAVINGDDDFTNVGAPNNNYGTVFVATGTTPAKWTNGSELDYNTGAPVVTVLENTIGNVWFSYGSPGYYLLNSLSLFTDNKTFALYTPSTLGNFNVLATQIDSINQVAIDCYDSTLTEADNLLVNTPIEIRVYN